ncbi:unnamed protein product [Paramecium pentaurelia]|uniref:Transmembrane protein n=1 Tax=Paramecium pentaurelia TaxID=43138 RepID=A0A8S1V465_9CILI|nr:unnamed protein product [Paramecium pentaurelia]
MNPFNQEGFISESDQESDRLSNLDSHGLSPIMKSLSIQYQEESFELPVQLNIMKSYDLLCQKNYFHNLKIIISVQIILITIVPLIIKNKLQQIISRSISMA